MHFHTLTLVLTLTALTAASPLQQPKEITPDELAALSEVTLDRRDGPLKPPQPITDAELAALNAIDTRDTLEARDKRANCAKNVLGDKTIGGHGIWVPVDQYLVQARRFCHDYTSTDVAINHEVSDTYPVTLTNQDDPGAAGDAGNVVFAIFNTNMSPTYLVTEEQCYDSMAKQSNTDSKCYGKKNHDTKGGYWSVSAVGYFGSEVYKV